MTLSSTIRTLMGGTVPSSRDAEAGFGFLSPLVAADGLGPIFFFLGR